MRFWVIEEDELLLLGAVDSLELECEQCLFECLLITLWDQKFSFSPNPPEQPLYIHSCFINKPMSLLKPNSLDRLDVVAARQDARNQQHILGESPKVELLNIGQVVQVNLHSLSCIVHLEEALFDSEGQQVRVLGDDDICLASLPHVGELGICFIGRHDELNSHCLGYMNKLVGHLGGDVDGS